MADRVLERVTEAVLHESLLLHIADGPYPEYVRNLSAVKKAIVFVRLRAAGCRGYGAGLQDAGGRLGGGARSRAVRPRASPQRASTDRHSRAVRADALNVRSIERGVDVPTDQPRQLVLRDRREAMPSSSRKAPRSGSRKMSASLSCASPSSLSPRRPESHAGEAHCCPYSRVRSDLSPSPDAILAAAALSADVEAVVSADQAFGELPDLPYVDPTSPAFDRLLPN